MRTTFACMLGIALTVTSAIPAAADPTATPVYPTAARGPVVEDHFGTKIADPYRWLENDVRSDPQVRTWVDAESRLTAGYLAALPGRARIDARLTQLWNYERFSVPVKKGGRYFFARNDGLQNQSPLYVRDGATAAPRLLIDPNLWAKDGATALAEWAPSEDGRTLVYAVQDGGTDWRTVKFLDVATGRIADDELKWVKSSDLAWARDGSGIYYSRFPEPAAGRTFLNVSLDQTLWFHKLGTPQSADRLIYATPDHPKWGHSGEVTDDGAWLVVTTGEGTDPRFEVHLLDLRKPGAKPVAMAEGIQHNWSLVGGIGDRLWFVTDKDAPLQRIVLVDAAHPTAAPKQIVAEGRFPIESATLIGGRIFVSSLEDAKSALRRYTLDGKAEGTVALPGPGTVGALHGDVGEPEMLYSFTSYTTPTEVLRYDVSTGGSAVFTAPKVAFDPADYVTEQRFYPSKDGTKVPIFIVHRKDLDLSHGAPTLLWGYGGFMIPVTPAFSPATIQWMEMGGVFASANLRGGSEYGNAWHDGGRRHNKQNVFDDFIAAGEYLIAQGITTKGKLAIRGGSNGGLLVGAVVNQRPDLFAAAIPQVGVMDMLRFHKFTAGRYWTDDYGDPDVEADFRYILKYSPYHNIRDGVAYPPILVTTADTDDRVVPGHSFKYAAALQHADAGPKPHLIRIETRAGHGSGKPVSKTIEEYADMWAFAGYWTGLTKGM